MQTTYKGYVIRQLIADNGYSISKGGFHIAYARSLEDAKQQIDQLV